jgi:serpin B
VKFGINSWQIILSPVLKTNNNVMKTTILFIITAMLLGFSSCKKENPEIPQEPTVITLPEKANDVILQNNNFGIDLFKKTALSENTNLMLSPLSANIALTMLLNGCNTQTYEQIRDMLGYGDLTMDEINATYKSLVSQLLAADPQVNIALANAVWYKNGFAVKPAYLGAMGASFDAEIGSLDFNSPSALETINGWASDNTKGKIPKVINEISPDAVMFLMNALYFKGTWTYQFDKNLTANRTFYLGDGTSKQASSMSSDINVKYFATSDYSAIEMPYGRQNFSMVVILPAATLDNFMENFNGSDWMQLTNEFDENTSTYEIEVTMPRFKFEFEKELNEQLKALGMTDAFYPELADLSNISDENIYVSFVQQNTFVDVNEEGTEAAAVTTVGINYTSAGPDPFIVDKPFVFAIRERTANTLLFIGKVEDPEY